MERSILRLNTSLLKKQFDTCKNGRLALLGNNSIFNNDFDSHETVNAFFRKFENDIILKFHKRQHSDFRRSHERQMTELTTMSSKKVICFTFC